MTQEEVKAKMQKGFAKIQPKIAEMTSIIMDAYQEGFNTCFELLTDDNQSNKMVQNCINNNVHELKDSED